MNRRVVFLQYVIKKQEDEDADDEKENLAGQLEEPRTRA